MTESIVTKPSVVSLARCFYRPPESKILRRLPDTIFVQSQKTESGQDADQGPMSMSPAESGGHVTKGIGSGHTPQITPAPQGGGGENRVLIQRDTVIDKYRIIEVIGRGGFAVVYKAMHVILETEVALKIIRPSLSRKNPHLINAMCEEARFAAQVNHSNVVKIIDATGNRKLSYIVMEYIDGETLHDRVRRSGPLAVADVCQRAIDVCLGLQAALEKGLVHRDIKPQNIILPNNQSPTKIVDLGLASPVDVDPSQKAHQAGMIVGTPSFMAPEQAIQPEACSHVSDIYSLGVTLFFALVGRTPYQAKTSVAMVREHLQTPVPVLYQLDSRVPLRLSHLIKTMMAKKPIDRPSDYSQLITELQAIQNEIV